MGGGLSIFQKCLNYTLLSDPILKKKNQSELRDNDLNVQTKEVETNEDIIEEVVDIAKEIVNAEKSVSKAMNLMLLFFLTILLITIPIIKFAVNILMCVLTLMYMHLFVALPLLDAMLNIFLETNTKFMEYFFLTNVDQMVEEDLTQLKIL